MADFLSHLGKWVKLIKFEAENEFFALGRLKNHKVAHLHPNSTTFMPLDRHQLKIQGGFFNLPSAKILIFSLKFDQFDPFSQMTQKVCQKSAI